MNDVIKDSTPPIQPGRLQTYMIFTKKGKGFGRLMGPILGLEIERIKNRFFYDVKTVHVLEESVFISIYNKRYWQHIAASGWMDKLYTYFVLNQQWTGRVAANIEERSFSADWFKMFEVITEQGKQLHVQFLTGCNKFHKSHLIMELIRILPFKPYVGDDYYKGTNDKLYIGTSAVRRKLAEESIRSGVLS